MSAIATRRPSPASPRARGPLRFALGALLLAVSGLAGVALAADDLALHDWRIDAVRQGERLRALDPARGDAVLRFEDGRIFGSGGCNRLTGAYRLDGDRLRIDGNLAMTQMACPEPLMAQERAVVDALRAAETFSIDNQVLTLSAADGAPTLRLGVRRSRPLAGTVWRLTDVNNGRGGVATVLDGTDFTLTLAANGSLSGKACNRFRGRVETDGDAFRLVGPLAATRMACIGPDGAGAQEAELFAALERAERYRIEGDVLTLRDGDGALQARFEALPDAAGASDD